MSEHSVWSVKDTETGEVECRFEFRGEAAFFARQIEEYPGQYTVVAEKIEVDTTGK